ncbi:hypothetical protein BpHYR1_013608 [Brachionus plicatilis]|uniref:Uncharacterized protein n=1 Tax=Brachionus plicatilis TaxID=10195 RepID=A0A3M7PYN9_BRAPC|nr:hypothetical protein BpHYR1_013608 [Brachionus plicatilis]
MITFWTWPIFYTLISNRNMNKKSHRKSCPSYGVLSNYSRFALIRNSFIVRFILPFVTKKIKILNLRGRGPNRSRYN